MFFTIWPVEKIGCGGFNDIADSDIYPNEPFILLCLAENKPYEDRDSEGYSVHFVVD